MSSYRRILSALVCVGVFAWFLGCYPEVKKEVLKPEDALTPVRFFLPSFDDDLAWDSLSDAIDRNLVYLNKIDPETVFQYGPHSFTAAQVRETQKSFRALILEVPDPQQLNKKIRKQFRVYQVAGQTGNQKVLFTGYYEPVFEGRLAPDDSFKYPLYRVPDDLIKIDLSLFNQKYASERIMARIADQHVVPYYSRHEIDYEKVLAGRGFEIAWMRDPVDALFLHIQGSGRLKLADGSMMGVGYHASNGRPYRSIGKYMIQKDLLKKEGVTMQSIRRYLAENPEACDDILSQNSSYVFFRLREGEPVGNISVPLVPGRSLALDSRLFPKGALAFMSCQKPDISKDGEITGWRDFSRFVLNQDTGGAIKGPGRADLFWGSGSHAETAAGHMKHEGTLYLLIRKDFVP